MSASHSVGVPSAAGAAAMSSQSTAVAPATRYVASVRPSAPTAKNRAASPESLWVNQTPGSRVAAARPLDSAMRWSRHRNATCAGSLTTAVAPSRAGSASSAPAATALPTMRRVCLVHHGARGKGRLRRTTGGRMDYTHLGRTGLSVSRLCLGTMNFGPKTSEEDSHAIMDRALEHGINFFDTANVYGWKKGEGWTEQIIGRWFAQGGDRREKVVIATKLYGSTSDWPNDTFLSARNIRLACDASLRRLQTDWIDLYQMHHVDLDTPWDEIWEAMETLRTHGKILYVGSSNFAGWHLAAAQEAARQRHFLGLVSEQSFYNLAVRDIERETLPAAQHYGLGVIPWSPLYGGLLGGVLKKEAEGVRRTQGRAKEFLEGHREQVQAYEDLCDEIGDQPASVALAWLLSRPGVTGPIIGPRTLEQLDDAVAALDVDLDDKTLARLDEIWPAYKTAPEHYAW